MHLKDPFRDEPDWPISESRGWSNHLCRFRQRKKGLLVFLRFGFFLVLNVFHENFAVHVVITRFFSALEEASKHERSRVRSEWAVR